MRAGWCGLVCALVLSAVTPVRGAPPELRPIVTIDFYGQRTLEVEALRRALPIHEGEPVSPGDSARLKPDVVKALSALPHVRDARIALVCCAEDGGIHLFVGVQEDASPQLHFRAAPKGTLRLPQELVTQAGAIESGLVKAVMSGHGGEDDSQGHAFSTDAPELRALQEQNVLLAARNLRLLRRVLRESADAQQRAMAARFLGYAADLQSVTPDLARAVTDPDPLVRNDAMRALAVFANAKTPPHIPYGPFIDLLSSPEWTDLNKSSAALAGLSAGRDPELLEALRRRALPALVAMIRWRSHDHSGAAYWLLGRIGGLPEEEISSHWERDEPEPVVAAVLKRVPG